MPLLVTNGCTCECKYGNTACPLVVPPDICVQCSNNPVATIMDHVPAVNIASFGMCSSKANPAVAAVIASSNGSIKEAPCLPVLPKQWSPGSKTVRIGGNPVLNDKSTLLCQWSGTIKISKVNHSVCKVP